jgi:hypothetical protein
MLPMPLTPVDQIIPLSYYHLQARPWVKNKTFRENNNEKMLNFSKSAIQTTMPPISNWPQ